MKLSLFWKLMLSFALVVAIGLGAIIVIANQITNQELMSFMMGQDQGSMMGGGLGQGQGAMHGPSQMQQRTLDRVNQAVIIGGGVALLAALVIGFVVFRAITHPIDQLSHAAHSLARGDLSARVVTTAQPSRLGDDELTELGATFNVMADSLQKAEALRRDMTADIAHELRTPLAVMRGNLEAMLDGVYPPDAEHLQPVLNQVHLLTRLVEDLRTLALAEAGQLPLTKRPTDLGHLIETTLASFQAQAATQRMNLTAAALDELPAIDLDPDRVQQTIGILIANALRHTPADGSIKIALRRDAGQAIIEVADSGVGIPPDDLPHIFERFYRADKSRSRESGGSGLGLAIAKSIVQAHGGTIGATSTVGQGSTVRFTLPLKPNKMT
ncbi:MAG: HAMP domain-containing protein [Chloroflexi bacterium]|nr:HAMP domain-containing protein [Chloroflexota bacterium]